MVSVLQEDAKRQVYRENTGADPILRVHGTGRSWGSVKYGVDEAISKAAPGVLDWHLV
jgi:hypothetical protein